MSLPTTVSWLEFWWLLIGFIGFGFAVWCISYVWPIFRVVVASVQLGRASYDGPRFQFVFWFLMALVLALIAWVIFVTLGGIAASTPPPLTPAREKAADTFAYILIVGEIFFAAMMACLMLAWRTSIRAKAFVMPRRKRGT